MTRSIVLLTSLFSMLLSVPCHAEDAPKCPVSGDAVGGDKGKPVEVTYQGKSYTLCCKSCLKKFNASPEKYIKGLK